MLGFWLCVVIGVHRVRRDVIAMFKFRKSQGRGRRSTWSHNTKLETIWTVVPILILICWRGRRPS